jgi:NTE family protein
MTHLPVSPSGETSEAKPEEQTRLPVSPSGETRLPVSPSGETRLPVSPSGETSDPRFGDLELRSLSLFSGLDPSALRVIAERLEVQWIASGTDLFQQNDSADALYVLLSGALAVLHTAPAIGDSIATEAKWVGQVLAGETVGEMAMLSGKPRTATVRAIRDSEVLRFKRSDFEAMMATEPSAMLHIARVAFQRLEASQAGARKRDRQGRTFAIVPTMAAEQNSNSTETQDFAYALSDALGRFGDVALVTQASAGNESSGYFHALEQHSRFLIYVSQQNSGPWFELCRRQADEILHVVPKRALPALGPPDAHTQNAPRDVLKRERLVLLHTDQILAAQASAWRQAKPGALLHHAGDIDDIERIARFLTGNATGLVLGGGGARGFAHLGVVRALREHGQQIDAVGGTSIGAIVAAGVAMQWSDEELYQRYYASFVATNPLRDYTLPFIALVAGRKVTARLKLQYGDTLIEDLPLPYYCVSANLTRGILKEHRDGPLWRALRASIAIPGILSPVFHEGEVLVDGGVINNLPVDVMRRGLYGRVIAVDIAGDYAIKAQVEESDLPPVWKMMRDWFQGVRPRPSILQILLRSGMVNSASTAENNRKHSDWMIKPPVDQLELLDWQSFDRAIEIGYSHTRMLIEKGLVS